MYCTTALASAAGLFKNEERSRSIEYQAASAFLQKYTLDLIGDRKFSNSEIAAMAEGVIVFSSKQTSQFTKEELAIYGREIINEVDACLNLANALK